MFTTEFYEISRKNRAITMTALVTGQGGGTLCECVVRITKDTQRRMSSHALLKYFSMKTYILVCPQGFRYIPTFFHVSKIREELYPKDYAFHSCPESENLDFDSRFRISEKKSFSFRFRILEIEQSHYVQLYYL